MAKWPLAKGIHVKNTKALTATALTGALLLGGCAAEASTAPASSDSARATAEPTASQESSAVILPDPRGVEVTSIILDPSLDLLPPDTGQTVQTVMTDFYAAANSFPELQKGDRPARAEDTELIEPAVRPLLTDHGWDSVLNLMKDPKTIPTWYPAGNLFDRFKTGPDGTPAPDESLRRQWTPDENGFTAVFSSQAPITFAAWKYENGTLGVEARDVTYRWFFRNLEGDVMYISVTEDLVFVPSSSGWVLDGWSRAKSGNNGGGGVIATQEELDRLMSEF